MYTWNFLLRGSELVTFFQKQNLIAYVTNMLINNVLIFQLLNYHNFSKNKIYAIITSNLEVIRTFLLGQGL